MNEKVKVLFELGEAGRGRDWPDYLHYGFDESDVPALLALIQDGSLHNADGDSNEVWVPLYAWRILGQLKAAQAVQPLLALFDTLVEDDWAIAELPTVMGMIGEPALAALSVYFMETDHDEFARVMAVDGLAEIAKCYPDLRTRVIERFVQYMADPDTSVFVLNGLLICNLIDMDASEVIDDIRRLFALGCVDLSCAGDVEEVEIELGLRTERSTPPDYSLFPVVPPDLLLEKPDSDDLYELADYYLMKYGNDDSILEVSEMDGYFAALACAPETIMPSTWFPAMWGGKHLMPQWESKKELEEFNGLVFSFYNDVMQSMDEDNYEALFMERPGIKKTYLVVDEWCEGFLRGVNLWGPLAAQNAAFLAEQLQPMRVFATEAGWEQLDEMDDEQVEQQQLQVEPNVRRLYQHFREQRASLYQPVMRDTPKVGRNDPCPCGSGKKFKKCCLH